MSNAVERWYCRECKREWVEPKAYYMNSAPVSITGNPLNGKNCQTCGSPEIELVQFKPRMPGLDIPREDLPNLPKVTPQVLDRIPGHVTSQEITIRADISDTPLPLNQGIAAKKVIEQIEEDNKEYIPIDVSQMI